MNNSFVNASEINLDRVYELIKPDGYIEIVYLMVRSDNLPAIKLSDHSGFEKIALLPNDTKTTDEKYLLSAL